MGEDLHGKEVGAMAECVTCAYPMIHVANGNLGQLTGVDDPKAKEAMEKHGIELKENEDTPVGCYVCPKCGHCVWLET
jgi:hypothetical protein